MTTRARASRTWSARIADTLFGGRRDAADADGVQDLWDPAGVPDPITIALGEASVQRTRWRWTALTGPASRWR
jgi:hypothetical protein